MAMQNLYATLETNQRKNTVSAPASDWISAGFFAKESGSSMKKVRVGMTVDEDGKIRVLVEVWHNKKTEVKVVEMGKTVFGVPEGYDPDEHVEIDVEAMYNS